MKHPKSYDTTPEIRKRMSKVQLKGGKAETVLAKLLWSLGFRYRKNYKKLPGSPDIAILKYQIAIFVDGEFWHGKEWKTRKARLRHNREYWIEKIEEDVARDDRVDGELQNLGWIPIHFWEKDVLKTPDKCVSEVIELIIQEEDGSF